MFTLIDHIYKKFALWDCVKVGMMVVLFLFTSTMTPAFPRTIGAVPNVKPDSLSLPDPIFHDIVSRGINMVFDEQYAKSLSIFRELEEMYPNHPGPNFFKAATYQSWMSNFRINDFQQELEENVQLAIDKGNGWLRKGRDDPWLHFYVGAAYGYRAFNRFRKHDFIGAYLDGKKGVNNFDKALTIEPTLYDVYLGLGVYHYWRTAKSKFLRVIAFWMSDKRELGLRQIEFSVDHALYSRNEAIYALIVAFFDSGRYEKALNLYNRTIARKKRPSLSDLYYKGRLLIQFQRWEEAETTFQKILQRIEKREYTSVGYQIESKYWIALALMAQNKEFEALRVAEIALAQIEKRNVGSELEGPFENFKEVKNNLLTLHEDLLKKKTDNYLAGR